MFLSPRPGFAYLNRERLYDDLYRLCPDNLRAAVKPALDAVRKKAQEERYCIVPPSFQKCAY